jgi:hypothetical protein
MALMAYSHPQVDRDSIPTDLSHFFFFPQSHDGSIVLHYTVLHGSHQYTTVMYPSWKMIKNGNSVVDIHEYPRFSLQDDSIIAISSYSRAN